MRHHGWELPYHPLQVVVIAVFSSLAFSFYVFFVPFVGSKLLEYHAIAIFSPLVMAVFLLYVHCAAVNPADPGVSCSGAYSKAQSSCNPGIVQGVGVNEMQSENLRNPQQTSQESGPQEILSNSKVTVAKGRIWPSSFCIPFEKPKSFSRCSCVGKHQSVTQEELVYCGLCKAEISKYSKHCRACDKCVEGFDHHCRWINNCIGKRNYKTFFCLMTSSIMLLFLQWMVGIYVILRCLLNRRDFKEEIASKLGRSFSLVPFIVIVGLCTLLALVATLPLGQLLLFHLILIHKGISTYDYIVAMRELEQYPSVGKDFESQLSSPASSLSTTVSGPSNINTLQRKPWCSPPNMLVDFQEAVVPNAKGGWSFEIEAGNKASKVLQESVNKRKSRPVRISPWKLSQLNAKDATKAAARARGLSTISRPANNEETIITETDSSIESSNRSPAEIMPVLLSKMSTRTSDIPDYFFKAQLPSGKMDRKRQTQPLSVNAKRNYKVTLNQMAAQGEGIASLQSEARSILRQMTINPGTRFLVSPAERSDFSCDSQKLNLGAQLDQGPAASIGASPSDLTKHWTGMSTTDGYEASGGESADDSDYALSLSHSWSNPKFSHMEKAETQGVIIL